MRWPTWPEAHAMETLPITDRLAQQIEAFQKAFRTLPRGASVGDMARRFAAILGDVFAGGDIELYLRTEPSAAWDHLLGPGTRKPEDAMAASQDRASENCCLNASGRSMGILQRLPDGTELCLLLSRPQREAPYAEADVVSLRLFAHLFENAHQALNFRKSEKDLVFSLNQRVLQLTSLIDTGIEVAKLDRGTVVHGLALQRAVALTNASRGAVRVMAGDALKEEVLFPKGGGALPEDPALSITSAFEFSGEHYLFTLYGKESRAGIARFDQTDQLLLDALARQVHGALENRSLLEQALEKEKIERDLDVAASIQQTIIPKTLPTIDGYDVAGINIPTRSVGGDYYDCLPLADGRFALVVADVAGKGMPAALLVSTLHAYLSAYLESSFSLPELALKLNKAIYQASPDDRFITAIIVLLNPRSGQIESVNLGHNIGYLVREGGEVMELSEGGLALGMLDIDMPYMVDLTTITPGERLLLYSDGVPEATNTRDELFESTIPLETYTRENRPERASEFISDLIGKIRTFTGDAPQSDDITALYLLRR